jgi:hypothetical protein
MIRDWPGNDGAFLRLPSVVAYSTDNKVLAWGYECNNKDVLRDKSEKIEGFGKYLNPRMLASAHQAGLKLVKSVEHAKSLTKSYLRKVYEHIQTSLEPTWGSLGHKEIKFIFSVPQWVESQHILIDFKDCIRQAGYLSGNLTRHWVIISMMPEEAAGAFDLQNFDCTRGFEASMLLCIGHKNCTNIFPIRATDATGKITGLLQGWITTAVAEEFIDEGFETLVKIELKQYPSLNSRSEAWQTKIAAELSKSNLLIGIKKTIDITPAPEFFQIPLNALQQAFNEESEHPEAMIEDRYLSISR